MADTGVQRHLGGEGGHRTFFGGTAPKTRIAGLVLAFLLMVTLTPSFGIWALVTAALIAGITLLVTQGTHRGSILERRAKRSRWKKRLATGTDAYEPYDTATWAQLEEVLSTVKGRTAKWRARRDLMTMRAVPDGADGMGWLQHERGVPGIAWHAPLGEEPYLSVAFAVSGQLSGIESGSVMTRAAHEWGVFLANRAAPGSLVRDIQTLTRVVPADSALNEFWVSNSLDPNAPQEAIESYADVLRRTSAGAMVQRHYVVARWPLNAAFYDAGSRYGEGRDGWRDLMAQEISALESSLSAARLGSVVPLTARKTAALMLHQQNPSRPIDLVTDVDPAQLGLSSYDEFSAHVVSGTDPVSDTKVEWWHRTAAIHGSALATGPRSQLWLLDLLVGRGIHAVRSISFHLHLVPAAQAKAAARRDLTRDQADAIADAEAGRLANDETGTNMSAARRRYEDLSAGSHHHGAQWIGYVTISERTRAELMRASRALEDVCSTGLGIERLDWLDSYQAAASGTTWPIVRGQRRATASLATRAAERLAGTGEKDAIS